MREHEPQRASRAELERRLGIIRSNMPTLLRLFPDRAEFHNEFASFAADVTARASSRDAAWVQDQISSILSDHGVGDSRSE